MSFYALDFGGSTIDMILFNQQKKQIIETKSIESPVSAKKTFPYVLEKLEITQKILQQKKIVLTGGSTALFPSAENINGDKVGIIKINEFEAIAKGGLFLSQKKSGVVVSLGTGTAMVHAKNKNEWEHIRGTGLGGGTFLGLCSATVQNNNFFELKTLAEKGEIKNIDLSVGEIVGGNIGNLSADMTAANFAKFSHCSKKEDVALGIANLIGQSIASLAVEKAKNAGEKNIIVGGKFSRLLPVVKCMQKTAEAFGMKIILPEKAVFLTSIGAAVSYREK